MKAPAHGGHGYLVARILLFSVFCIGLILALWLPKTAMGKLVSLVGLAALVIMLGPFLPPRAPAERDKHD
jgi:hypothetical protein